MYDKDCYLNKIVYLFELDSIYKSDYQKELGQKRLFEETLFHGNYVALSYNQLTDSVAFLSAIYHEDTYEKIIDLFKLGVLKVSPYNDIRTPSQYVQERIDRCLADDDEIFLFSSIPLDLGNENKPLLRKLKNALQFSDVGILEEEILYNKNPKNIEFLLRYIKMILILSIENLAKTKSHQNKTLNFSNIIQTIIQKYSNANNTLLLTLNHFPISEAIQTLAKIESYLLKKSISLNNRSNWIAFYKSGEHNIMVNQNVWGLSEIIINLCYNYTVEQSIDGIHANYTEVGDDEFFEDFEKRLYQNWKDFNKGYYPCYQPVRVTELDYTSVDLPKWDTAHRILSKVHHYRAFKKTNGFSIKLRWIGLLTRYFLTAILTTITYVIVFILAEHLVDFTKEFLSEYFELIFDTISSMKTLSMLINAIFTTILFGIFGSLIAKLFRMPDILEAFKDIFVTIRDVRIVINYYLNHKI